MNKVSTIIGYIQEGDEDKTEEEQKKNGLAPANIEYRLKETDLVLYAARTPSPAKATYKKDTIAVFLTQVCLGEGDGGSPWGLWAQDLRIGEVGVQVLISRGYGAGTGVGGGE